MTWKVTFTIDVIQNFKSWAKAFAHVKLKNIRFSDTGRCCLKYSLVQFNLVPHSPEHHNQEQNKCKSECPGPYLSAINNCAIEDLNMLDTFLTHKDLFSTISGSTLDAQKKRKLEKAWLPGVTWWQLSGLTLTRVQTLPVSTKMRNTSSFQSLFIK